MIKINFQDLPNRTTPIRATNLNQMQDNIEEAIEEVEANIPNTKNAHTSSTTDTYNCNYINKLTDYSTDETIVGKWIDGKNLYRKVMTVAIPNTSVDGTFETAEYTVDSNVDTLLIKEAYREHNEGKHSPLPYISDGGYFIKIYNSRNDKNKIVIANSWHGSSDENAIVIVEYTKA